MSEPPFPSRQAAGVVAARPIAGEPRPASAPPSPLELPMLGRGEAALDLALIVLVTVFVPFGFELIVGAWRGRVALDTDVIPVLIIRKWLDALLTAGLLAYLVARHRLPVAAFGLRMSAWHQQAAWAVAALAGAYAWLLVTLIALLTLRPILPSIEEDVLRRTELIKALPVHDYTRTMLLLVPVALHEEMVFRGLLIPYLRRVTHRWWAAILASAALFAALHMEQGWLGVFQVLGVGSLLGLAFVRSRSLWPVTTAHFAFDFLQFQLIRAIW